MWKLSEPLAEMGSLNENYNENFHVPLVSKSALATNTSPSVKASLNWNSVWYVVLT